MLKSYIVLTANFALFCVGIFIGMLFGRAPNASHEAGFFALRLVVAFLCLSYLCLIMSCVEKTKQKRLGMNPKKGGDE